MKSIRFKTSILYTLVLGIILLALSSANYLAIRHFLYKNLDKTLFDNARGVQTMLELFEEKDTRGIPAIDMFEFFMERYAPSHARKTQLLRYWWEREVASLGIKKKFITVYDDRKNLLLSFVNKNSEEVKAYLDQAKFSANELVYTSVKGPNHVRVISYPFVYRENFRYVVLIGASLESIDSILKTSIMFSLVAILVILLITSFMGRILTNSVLRPIKKVISLANDISHKDLSKRLLEQSTDKEMRELVASFNQMLGRLQNSFMQVNEFSSHVAHELKTPLAIIKGEMEVALMSDRGIDEYKEVLRICLEEVDRQIKIVEDLLFIARVDYRKEMFNFKEQDIGQLLLEVYEQYSIIANDKEFNLKFEPIFDNLNVNVDSAHIKRLIFNLLNNALKYSYQGSDIDLRLEKDNAYAKISVRDYGRGIASEDKEKIFNKFYRVQSSDVNQQFSCGLGLSIAQAIAKAHSGKIQVNSTVGKGSCFSLYLPLI